MPGKTMILGISITLLLGAGAFMPERSASAETMHTLTQTNNAFAWDLYAQLSANEGNLFFSPYSISAALAMTYAGARGNTEEQIAETLHFTLEQEGLHPAFHELAEHFKGLQQSGSVSLQMANSLWVERTIQLLQAFVEMTRHYYDANLFQVDFATSSEACRAQINEWVADNTEQKITELLQEGDITKDTTLVLTNAIYFKADWLTPFDTKETSSDDFWIDADTAVSVPTMHFKGSFDYTENELGQVAALPYAGENLYMFIALPWDKDGITELEAQVSSDTIESWIEGFIPQKLDLALPTFTMRSRFSLLETLQSMGMTDISDFSGISTPSLPLTNIIHEAFIDVNEQGTEAAASTAVTFGRSLPRYLDFHADHPFLFFIYDSTSKSTLFIGRIADPSS